MNRERPGLLVVVLTWIAYIICALIFGFSLWFVDSLGIASIVLLVILLLIVWKNKENKNDF
ncbi:hypothetical protein M3197_06440 [Sporosarcina aquimarina]|nr:hypothetical protein [Sporosarcina aquimarina]